MSENRQILQAKRRRDAAHQPSGEDGFAPSGGRARLRGEEPSETRPPVRRNRRGKFRAEQSALRKFRRNRYWLLLFLWLALVYSEIVVRSSTISTVFWRAGLWLGMLFAIPSAMLVFLLATQFKPKWNRIVVLVFLAVTYLLYASQLVYYKVFSQYYSATSMGNAGQVAQFWQVVLSTIWKNLIKLLILAAPLIFMAAWGRRFFGFRGGVPWQSSVFLGGVTVLCYFVITWILPLWGTDAQSPYSMFHNVNGLKESAAQLGLGTAFSRDVKWTVTGGGGSGSLVLPESTDPPETSEEGASAAQTSEPPEATEPEADAGPNVLNLDFDALIAGEDNEEIRQMHEYFNSIQPTNKNEKTGMFEGCNLILITAEGFSHLAIDPERTPTLYKLQTEGFYFTNFYTPIWSVSTSDGEYVAVTGTIPKSGVWSFYRSSDNYMPLTMCAQLKNLGYSAYAYHDHDYAYYDRDLSHPNLGYIYKGVGNGLEITESWPESDLEMIDVTTGEYINEEPFHAYYMTVSGHLEYNFAGNAMAMKNKDLVEDEPYSEHVRAYLACQIELDRALELLLKRLEEAGVAENTVIALTADHYPYGLTNEEQSELAGHTLEENFELYRNACIIYKKGMTPEQVDRPCSSLDLLPTLCNLFGLDFDSRLYMGQDVFSEADPLIIFSNRSWITDRASYNSQTGEVINFTDEEVSDDYIQSIKDAVNNKFTISARILDQDYWRVLFQPDS